MSQRDASGRVTERDQSDPSPGDPLDVRPFRRRPMVAFATGVLAGAAAAVAIMVMVVLLGPGIIDGVQDAVDAAVGADATTTGTGAAGDADVAPATTSDPLTTTTDPSVVESSTTAVPSLFGASMSGRRVVAVGDSLLASVEQGLSNRLAPAEIEIDAEQSRPVEGGLSAVRDLVDDDADIVVVALGTNNVNPGFEFEGYVEELADEVAAAACVLWVDVQEFRPGLVRVNEIIHDVAAQRGFTVVEWSDVAGESELHAGDGYHLSPAGQAAYADLIADGVRGCPPADDVSTFGSD